MAQALGIQLSSSLRRAARLDLAERLAAATRLHWNGHCDAPVMQRIQVIRSAGFYASLGVVSALGCVTSHEPEPTAEAEIANGGGGQAQCLPELIATRATPRQAIAGVIHREDLVDAVNLSLESDGSARLAIFGCDFCGEESPARWQPDGEDVLVLPREGDAHLAWYDDEGLEAAVSEVRLSRRPDGRIDAEVTSALSTYVQVWLDDRVCAKCCSGLGPTGLFLCDSPLPVEPCDQNVTWSCSADCEVATLTAG